MTIEAALVLSLFIFFLVCLMAPAKLMNQQRQIQAVLESVCEKASRYAYIQDSMERGELHPENIEGISEYGQYLGMAVGAYAAAQVMSQVNTDAITNISFTGSSIMEDGETIDLVLRYKMKLPFTIFSLESIPASSRSIRRAWIGKSGLDQLQSSGEAANGRNEIVYIGKNSTRYHKNRECHYLYNHLEAVSLIEVDTYRNNDGSRYRPCSYCGKAAEDVVYIMPGGDRYHSSKNCMAIIAYVKAVPLSEAEYLGGCSYCARG